MLDIQFIRDNAELVKEKAKQKNSKADIDGFLDFDLQRRSLLQEVEQLRQNRNNIAQKIQSAPGKPDQKLVEKGRKLKSDLVEKEEKLSEMEKKWKNAWEDIPNIFPDDTPLGGEDANKPIKQHGEAVKATVQDHLSWAESKGLLDFKRGAKVAGNKFYFTKGALVELEIACIQLALNLAIKHGFIPITVPHLINEKTSSGAGFSPRGEEDQIYKIENEDLLLIATAETPITGYHADEVFEAKDLPLLYVGISPAYRKEAGAYGKHSKGLYRVHQFNKVELYVFCLPEESEKWHEKFLAVEEELCQLLDIPYQIVRIASGDLGASAYKKYDIEYWSPVEQSYRELMSCSNVTDYQARRLQIRYRKSDGSIEFVNSLNGTAMAFSRTAIALIENHQDDHGDVTIPKELQKYMGGKQKI